jgi:hypothetical protein
VCPLVIEPNSCLRWCFADPVCQAMSSELWPSLRRVLCDLIEERGRHTGHADLLREAVDGRVGEDPPPGWRPVSGRSN